MRNVTIRSKLIVTLIGPLLVLTVLALVGMFLAVPGLRARVHDAPEAEIAERVGVSQMHVSRLIRRSLEKIRAEIAADEEEAKAAQG